MKKMLVTVCFIIVSLTACSNPSERTFLENWQKATSSPLLLAHNEPAITDIQKLDCIPGKVLRAELGSYYLPSTFEKSKKYPLIILLHPMLNLEVPSPDMDDFNFLSHHSWIQQAERRGYILCSVHSTHPCWEENENSADIRNIQEMIITMRLNFPVRDDKICLFGLTYLTNTMLLANLEISPGRRLFSAFITGYGGSGFIMDNFLSHDFIPLEFKMPGFLFWGTKTVGRGRTVKLLSDFSSSQGWDITTLEHEGWSYIPEEIIPKTFDWLDEKIP